jgi:hypothetical protein
MNKTEIEITQFKKWCENIDELKPILSSINRIIK